MRRVGMVALVVGMIGGGAKADPSLARTRAAQIAAKFNDPRGGIFVVAHRGCHNPSPQHAMPSAPENSLQGLAQCIRLGVDMMETDVRRTKDGAFVIMHDPSVDRTTEGTGLVADLTLAQIRRLHLRKNFGGEMSPVLTDQQVPTLDEMLAAAKGRIMLNLDIKEAIYPEVIDAAVKAGVADEVLVKTDVKAVKAPLADSAPYRAVAYMPVIYRQDGASAPDLADVVAAQAAGRHRIPAVEMVYLNQPQFEAVRAAARTADIRLWTNSLTEVGVLGVVTMGGDIEALRDHGSTWGGLIDAGVTVIQTDEPAALLDYLKDRR
jgi:glycerophosphoryl diester phosphodiesterase